MIAEVPGMTEEVYGGMIEQMMPQLKAAPGFLAHAGGLNPEGQWAVIEMWESEEDAERWFVEVVRPALPPGMEPSRSYHPAHTAFTA
jgi:heme-degrading monooxygenase HmoA